MRERGGRAGNKKLTFSLSLSLSLVSSLHSHALLEQQEFMPNGDLYSAIRDDGIGRFTWTRKPGPSGRPLPNTGINRRIALDIARGLHFLHSRRVVHLDLKSPNILLARDFTAKGWLWFCLLAFFF